MVSGISRRSFLKRAGVGVAAVAAAPLVNLLPPAAETAVIPVAGPGKALSRIPAGRLAVPGGFCAPLNPHYDVAWVRDALPALGVPRGRIEFGSLS